MLGEPEGVGVLGSRSIASSAGIDVEVIGYVLMELNLWFRYFFSSNESCKIGGKKKRVKTPNDQCCFRRVWCEIIARLNFLLTLDSVIKLLPSKLSPPNKHNFPNCLSLLN